MFGTPRLPILVALLIGSASGAQTLRGTVRDSATGGLIPGVVVTQLDDKGGVLARVVTDADGFAIVRAPQATRLNFRRIGFAPVDTTLPAGPRLDVVLRPVATTLAPMQTTNDRRCDERDDRARAMALWDEARSSMLATFVARETREATAAILVFDYQSTPGSGNRTAQKVTRTEARRSGRILGAAKPAGEFARDGYRRDSVDGDVYYAPDETVLVDESFIATHCFSVADRPRGDDSTIAIRFEPDRNRKHVDIEGEAVLRKEPLELLRIDYRYVGIENELRRVRPGGFLEYRAMPIGVSMAIHWHMRIPVHLPGFHVGRRRDTVRDVYVDRYLGSSVATRLRETGAVLERIAWSDSLQWVRPLPSISGRVVLEGRGPRTEPGLEARLTNSPYEALTDSAGGFTITNVLPGVYDYVARDTITRLYGVGTAPRMRIEVDSIGVTKVKEMEVTRRAASIAAACKPNPRDNRVFNVPVTGPGGESVILGRTEGASTATMKLTAILREAGRPDSLVLKGTTTSDGTFLICGIPMRRSLTISVDGANGRGTTRIAVTDPLHFVTLNLSPRRDSLPR
jgi:hypothetical protein